MNIAKILKLKNREGIKNILKWNNIQIRPRGFYLRGEKNSNYKGGHITPQGYKRISIGNGKQVMEHRKIMEEHVGRKLKKEEHVHHLNGSKLDNRIENLAIFTPYKHGELHAKEFNNLKKMYCSRIAELEHFITSIC